MPHPHRPFLSVRTLQTLHTQLNQLAIADPAFVAAIGTLGLGSRMVAVRPR